MHITIAGNLGSGKSTVCKYLQKEYGFEVYSTGAIQRKLAEELSIGILELNTIMAQDLKYDHMVDEATAKLAEEQHTPPIVFDSRMAWKFAKDTFKVFMVVDPLVAAKRVIAGRRETVEHYSCVEEARSKLLERSKLENERFKRIYHVDNLDYANYNLVIDTTFASPEEIGTLIYNKYLSYCKNPTRTTEIIISPQLLFPLQSIRNINTKTVREYMDEQKYKNCPISIVAFDGYHYVVDGHHRMLAALANKEGFVCVNLFDPVKYPFFTNWENIVSEISCTNISTVYDYEEAGNFVYFSYPEYYKR